MRKVLFAFALLAVILSTMCSCGSKLEFNQDSLTNKSNTVSVENAFLSTDKSEIADVDSPKVKVFINTVKSQAVD